MKMKIIFITLLLCLFQRVSSQGDGYLHKDGKRLFVIGSYYLPKEDAALKEMIDAGFNLFNCGSKEDLDRLQKFGVQGWISLPLAEGVTTKLKTLVGSVVGHPALAVWEGPDEVVWGFTALSNLYKQMKIHKTQDSWQILSAEAVKYAKDQSKIIMPNINNAIAYLRSVDPNNLQVWINEAENSDMGYVNQYIDAIDITGCDIYPIKSSRVNGSTKSRSSMQSIGRNAKRWTVASEGKPVWMVLQGFSWSELAVIDPIKFKDRPIAYPSFKESRYMAYDVIANNTRGVLYWDMKYLTSNEYRESLYCLANEFNALQSFLTTDPKQITVSTYQPGQYVANQVAATARQYGRDWMVALVNESDTTQLAVVVEGLPHLNGYKLLELYGEDEVLVRNGKFITRLKPFEVKVFATDRKWEAINNKGRNYLGL